LPTVPIRDFVEPKIRLGSPPNYPRCINSPVPPGGLCRKEQFIETFPNDVTHRILNIRGEMGEPGRSGPDNTPVFEVPAGHVFFMGDNRDNSVDSRFMSQVGFVPLENLIGRADLIALSSEGAFWEVWKWRLSRLLKAVE